MTREITSRFLRACACRPADATPIWFMRQAGRAMPGYRELRERHSFQTLLTTPELATTVTLEPVQQLGVDAAIVFGDILPLLQAMGVHVEFSPTGGPRVEPLRDALAVNALRVPDPGEAAPFTLEALRLTARELNHEGTGGDRETGSSQRESTGLQNERSDRVSGAAGPARLDSGDTGPVRDASGSTGPARLDSGSAGPARHDSGGAGLDGGSASPDGQAGTAEGARRSAGERAAGPADPAGQTGQDVALIGFSGAPFTLACYALDGTSSGAFVTARRTALGDPRTFHALMDKLTEAVGNYLAAQAVAGAQALQLFDTWAGLLSPADYNHLVRPYMVRLVAGLRSIGLPVISFATGTGGMLDLMASPHPDVVGIDWRVDLDAARRTLGEGMAVQGNLDPAVLLAGWEATQSRADDVLERAGTAPGHIFNLGHGVLPGTDAGVLRELVGFVHEQTATGDKRPATAPGGDNSPMSCTSSSQPTHRAEMQTS